MSFLQRIRDNRGDPPDVLTQAAEPIEAPRIFARLGIAGRAKVRPVYGDQYIDILNQESFWWDGKEWVQQNAKVEGQAPFIGGRNPREPFLAGLTIGRGGGHLSGGSNGGTGSAPAPNQDVTGVLIPGVNPPTSPVTGGTPFADLTGPFGGYTNTPRTVTGTPVSDTETITPGDAGAGTFDVTMHYTCALSGVAAGDAVLEFLRDGVVFASTDNTASAAFMQLAFEQVGAWDGLSHIYVARVRKLNGGVANFTVASSTISLVFGTLAYV